MKTSGTITLRPTPQGRKAYQEILGTKVGSTAESKRDYLYANIRTSRASQSTMNQYIASGVQTANITPKTRVEIILKEADALMNEDASLFHEVVKQLSEKGNALLGENHPLVRFFNKGRDPEYLKRTDESMTEVRKQSQG